MDALLNPLLYIAFAIIIWQCFRLRTQHRHFWGISLFSPGRLSVRRTVTAVVVGVALSSFVVLSEWDFGLSAVYGWWLWAALVLLGLARVRFMGFSYVAGAVSVLALVSDLVDAGAGVLSQEPFPQALLSSLQAIDVGNLLLLAGVLTIVGGLLAIWEGARSYCPLLLTRRGKSVGAVAMQALWVAPVLLPVADGWLILPVLLVYSDLAITRHAQQRARLTGLWTVGFGMTLAALGLAGIYMETILWVGAIVALLGQEVITRLSGRQERNGKPKFRINEDGIRVLAVKAESPAAKMGIRPGETITHANSKKVGSMTELYAALQLSPAFCKLEVVNEDGEQRFAQRSLYADEPHQLGIIPVSPTTRVMEPLPHRIGWWGLLLRRSDYRKSNVTESRIDV